MHTEKTPTLRRLDWHYIAMQMGFWAMFAAIVAYQTALLLERGFTNGEAGLMTSVRCLAGIVFQPLLGGFADRHLSFGVAAEMPVVSGTYGERFAAIPQRVPDIPLYFQYAWGADRSSHLRASAVLRNIYLHDLERDSNTSLLGWGVQFSGTIRCCRFLRLFMNGVYGKGITPYIQDLTGSGLDFTPWAHDATHVGTLPMWGWQVAAQLNLTPRLFLSGGYSTVRVQRNHGFYAADQYHRGNYVFGNLFYALSPRCQIAGEYLYGSRRDRSDASGHAHRINVMVQYSF